MSHLLTVQRYRLTKLCALLLFLTACSFGSSNLQSRHVSDVEARRIRRIAVVPPSVLSSQAQAEVPLTTTPGARTGEREAPGQGLAAAQQLARAPGGVISPAVSAR